LSANFRPPVLFQESSSQINQRDFDCKRRDNNLVGLSAGVFKNRPKYLVTSDDLVEALLQCVYVEISFEPAGEKEVIGETAGVKLVEKPQALLGARER
jgi:hypothetical protein